MISFAVRVKENRVKGDLGAFRKYLHKMTGDLLKQEACLTARAALKYAPPLVAGGGKGDTAAAAKMGIRAIDKDVRAIFAAPGSTLQSVFKGGRTGNLEDFVSWRAKPLRAVSSTLIKAIHEDGDIDRAFRRAQNIYVGKEDRSQKVDNLASMATLHNQERKNGRVVREGRPSKEVKRYPHIAKEAMIKRYIKMRALQVGKLKSGWWEIISTHGRNLNIFGRTVDAGAKGLPKYITRHQGPGTLSLVPAGGASQRVTIRNLIGDADGAGLRANTQGLVISHRLGAISKRPYQKYASRLVRNWNAMQRPNA